MGYNGGGEGGDPKAWLEREDWRMNMSVTLPDWKGTAYPASLPGVFHRCILLSTLSWYKGAGEFSSDTNVALAHLWLWLLLLLLLLLLLA